AFAGNPLLIDPERLADEGLLERAELAPPTDLPTHRVDYGRVIPHRYGLLGAAADRFAREAGAEQRRELAEFREAQRHWLPDYALYRALKEENEGRPWNEWPAGVRLRRDQDLAAARDRLAASVLRH